MWGCFYSIHLFSVFSVPLWFGNVLSVLKDAKRSWHRCVYVDGFAK